MIGRQVILINKPLTLQELEQIMQDNWDKEQYGSFKIGRPTPASIEEYILLPATRRYLTIVYPRAAGGFFSKENKVITAAEYFADEKRPECRKREKRPGRRNAAGLHCAHERNSKKEWFTQMICYKGV